MPKRNSFWYLKIIFIIYIIKMDYNIIKHKLLYDKTMKELFYKINTPIFVDYNDKRYKLCKEFQKKNNLDIEWCFGIIDFDKHHIYNKIKKIMFIMLRNEYYIEDINLDCNTWSDLYKIIDNLTIKKYSNLCIYNIKKNNDYLIVYIESTITNNLMFSKL